jgi:hypothetical protein
MAMIAVMSAGRPRMVHRQNCPGFGRDRRSIFLGSSEGRGVESQNTGIAPFISDRLRRGNKRVRRQDHLIPPRRVKLREGGDQRDWCR